MNTYINLEYLKKQLFRLNMNFCTYVSPLGLLKVSTQNNFLTCIQFHTQEKPTLPNTTLLVEICHQLDEYFSLRRKIFHLPIQLNGTQFQIKVWKALQSVPYGQTQSYKFIAEKINNPKAVRAVGQAIHRNHIPIIIPCHRIIGSNGSLVGFADGLEIKEYLLRLENALPSSSKA